MMEEKGQVFTLDLLIAIGLFLLVVTTSGHAMTVVGQQSGEFVSRHSLERRAHDAADMLVSSPGNPHNWYRKPENVNTPGLIEPVEGEDGLKNTVDARKFFALENLDDEELEDLFGTKNFMIEYEGMPDVITHENSTNIETSPDVTSVRRLTYGRNLDVRAESPPVFHDPAIPSSDPTHFYIDNEDLEEYDWYLFVENTTETPPQNIDVSFNIEAPPTHYAFDGEDLPDQKRIDENEYLKPENNFMDHFIRGHGQGDVTDPVNIYVVASEDEDLEIEPEMVKEEARTLTVSVWR